MPHGVDDLDWDVRVDETIAILTGVARRRTTTKYDDLADELGRRIPGSPIDPHYGPMPHLLEAVNIVLRERDPSVPMLSALVVRGDSGDPGNGFYGAAKRLGHRIDDRLTVWAEQVAACHEWARR